MSDINVKLEWLGGMKFKGLNSNGYETMMDGDSTVGTTPIEMLLQVLGGCTAIDVVIIMEKSRTPATRMELSIDGDRRADNPRYFTAIRVRFDVWGEDINPDKLERAINLSFDKYCSVYNSLRLDINLSREFRIHTPNAEPSGEYSSV